MLLWRVKMADTILVTGGYGFIGTNFIRYILPISGLNIINLDIETYAANTKNLEDLKLNKKLFSVKGDIADRNLVMQILDETKPKYIVNFAAESHVDNTLKDEGPCWHTNFKGTLNLLECARDYGNLEKFLQISTDEVYGSIPQGAFNEDSQFNPTSPYSKSKAAAERIARDFARTGEVPVLITRSSNNFGPYQHPEKFIPRSITNILVGAKIPLMNKGVNIRDWIYVLDNVDAIYQVLLKGRVGEAYNISGGNELKNIEIVEMILGRLKEEDNEEDRHKWIGEIEDRKNHDLRYAITGTKIRRELGWEPKFTGKYNVENIIQYTCDWYVQNYRWWIDSKKKAEERHGMGELMFPLIESYNNIRSEEEAQKKAAEEAKAKAEEEAIREKEAASWASQVYRKE
jgi:dTDP-glucose 4,6-dehydratase